MSLIKKLFITFLFMIIFLLLLPINSIFASNTTVSIFLLSIDEVLRYFGDSGLVARGATMGANKRANNAPNWPSWGIYSPGIHDQYSEARIAQDLGGSASWWWLRSPGYFPFLAAYVSLNGYLILFGDSAFGRVGVYGGVRPALWLYLCEHFTQ